jgi:hypothetical protein
MSSINPGGSASSQYHHKKCILPACPAVFCGEASYFFIAGHLNGNEKEKCSSL